MIGKARRAIQGFIHRLVGPDKYHDNANRLNNRGLRLELLNRRLEVIERRHGPR